MTQLTDRIFGLTPNPSVILDSSFCVQKVSDSFLRFTRSKSSVWDNFDFFEQLQSVSHFTMLDRLRIQAATKETVKMHRVQYAMMGADHVQGLRVTPIVEDGVLLHVVLEWELNTERNRKAGADSAGLGTEEAFRLLVGAVKDYAIFLLDVEGNVRTWNIGAELIKGYKSHEIIGRNFSAFYGEDDLKTNKPSKELEICLREGRVEDEGWRYRKDGTRFWANVVITAIFDHGVHVGFGKVTRDLTERKNAEARLIAAYEESSKLKSKFLANMSHEIRTPMHGMLSANTLLSETELSKEQQDLSNIIHESGKVLLQVLNDILDYSKLTAGSFSLNISVVDVAYTIKSVLRSYQSLLKPGVRLPLTISPDLPISVAGDPLRYRQVLQNLIGNAVKFTDHGSIHVHSSVIEQTNAPSLILTSIKDTGIGVPDSARHALFAPFRQFNNTNLNTYQGTGLGLSISKSLVELMDGQIGFTPNPECQGSIFWFTIPVKHIRNADDAATPHVQDLSLAHTKTRDFQEKLFGAKHILLVEDNLINQRVMVKILHSLGFKRIETALNGEQALSLIGDNEGVYDLILMDIDMPIMDGLTATQQMRRRKLQTPILALTANVLESDREMYYELGMNDCIPKPVEKDLLAHTLIEWLTQEHLPATVGDIQQSLQSDHPHMSSQCNMGTRSPIST